jgi:pyruvate formate lyase activating enzyme
MNIDGKLRTLVYGDLSSISANPIEKKPFFHFWPGSYALTVGTWGCNFACPWCQNWETSKYPPVPTKASYVSPEQLVRMVGLEHCQGTSISFNEPTTLFEYSLDVFATAKRNGFYNTFVSNGYMTFEALKLLRDAGMDAIKFDLKGDAQAVRRYCAADVDVVWRNIRAAKTLGMHVEVVTLVIPDVNEDEEALIGIAERCLKEVGPDVPLHFTRFYPAYMMTDRSPTPVSTLERARELARIRGIHYAYIGNIPGHRWENTYCHNCRELLIQRYGFSIMKYEITEGKRCPSCSVEIPISGRYVRSAGAWK